MKKTARNLLFLIFSLLLIERLAQGKPVIEHWQTLEIDWGNLKVRSSITETPQSSQDNYLTLEEKALKKAIGSMSDDFKTYYLKLLKELQLEESFANQNSNASGDAISRTTYVTERKFYKNGSVKLSLESQLSMKREDVISPNKPELTNSTEFSGIVLKANKPLKPRPFFKIINKNGDTLFDINMLQKDVYEKNLMGRWFQNPSPEELTPIIGKKQISLNFEVDDIGRLVVEDRAWNEVIQNCKGALKLARIVVIVPSSP